MLKYQRIKTVGEGSYGKAVLVKNKASSQKYVVKEVNVLKMHKQEREEARKEVQVLARMKHPNIVAYIESFEERGLLYIVMEYCDGGDLYQKINNQKSVHFPEDQIMDWFVQLTLAIKHVHDRKILHRDLKTQNIFLTRRNMIKLGDFGIAKVLRRTGELAKTAIGTPYYLSPEICEQKPYNNKSDIWSLGCILYEMATLKHAFEAGNMKGLVLKILRGTYPSIPSFYGRHLKTLIDKCLNKNPRDRPSANGILKMSFVRNRIAKFLSETIYANEFSHTVLHSNESLNHPTFTDANSKKKAAPAKKTPPVRSSSSSSALSVAGHAPKYSKPAAKYGAPLPAPAPRVSNLGAQRRRILQQAEKERQERQRKREAELVAIKKREDERKAAREKERLERERRRRDLLIAEKKKREANAAAREEKLKEAAEQKRKYEEAIKARHKAFEERQKNMLKQQNDTDNHDDILAEFLARKAAAKANRLRHQQDVFQPSSNPPETQSQLMKTMESVTSQASHVEAAEARSPAPAPPPGTGIRVSVDEAQTAVAKSEAAAKLEETIAMSRAKRRHRLSKGSGEEGPSRRRWGRSESPPILNPAAVGTTVLGLTKNPALPDTGEGQGDSIDDSAKTDNGKDNPMRKRWLQSPEVPDIISIGTVAVGTGIISEIRNNETTQVSVDPVTAVADEKMTDIIEESDPSTSTTVTEKSATKEEVGKQGEENEQEEKVEVTQEGETKEDASTNVNDGGVDITDNTEDEEEKEDDEDLAYAEMLSTMRDVLGSRKIVHKVETNIDDSNASSSSNTANDLPTNGAETPPSEETIKKTTDQKEDDEDSEHEADVTIIAENQDNSKNKESENGTGVTITDAVEDVGSVNMTTVTGSENAVIEHEETADDSEDSYFEDDDEADDILIDDEQASHEISDPQVGEVALPVNPMSPRETSDGDDDDDDDDADEMYDTLQRMLENATPEKREQIAKAAPELTVGTLLKSGPVPGLELIGDTAESFKVGVRRDELSVFHRLEETRAELEDKLGPVVFVQTYKKIQAWREDDDDDEASEQRRTEIENLLETQHASKLFQQLLHLVISDATHFETGVAECPQEFDEGAHIDSIDSEIPRESGQEGDGDIDFTIDSSRRHTSLSVSVAKPKRRPLRPATSKTADTKTTSSYRGHESDVEAGPESTDAGDAIPLKRASAIVSQPSESKDADDVDSEDKEDDEVIAEEIVKPASKAGQWYSAN
eukprot:m.61962 g.61962  ORF g.61962 m.61962 type:complete len:1230 (-) comp11469_c0_seq2:108-3797(-)